MFLLAIGMICTCLLASYLMAIDNLDSFKEAVIEGVDDFGCSEPAYVCRGNQHSFEFSCDEVIVCVTYHCAKVNCPRGIEIWTSGDKEARSQAVRWHRLFAKRCRLKPVHLLDIPLRGKLQVVTRQWDPFSDGIQLEDGAEFSKSYLKAEFPELYETKVSGTDSESDTAAGL